VVPQSGADNFVGSLRELLVSQIREQFNQGSTAETEVAEATEVTEVTEVTEATEVTEVTETSAQPR
jgi:hypothetical protein